MAEPLRAKLHRRVGGYVCLTRGYHTLVLVEHHWHERTGVSRDAESVGKWSLPMTPCGVGWLTCETEHQNATTQEETARLAALAFDLCASCPELERCRSWGRDGPLHRLGRRLGLG